MRSFLIGALVGLSALASCREGEDAESSSSPPAAPFFTDATADTGLDFIHFNGMSGELLLPEVMGSGGALLDYDKDGDLDLFLVQGTRLPAASPTTDLADPKRAGSSGDRLYRNDLTLSPQGLPVVHFTDVTDDSGIRGDGYGMGVATGDFDDDGWVDLYVTNLGSNKLWRNLGDGSFADVTESAGVDDPRWSVPAAFFDLDRDGDLDLWVGNYADFRFASRKRCFSPSGRPDYCSPLAYGAVPDRLFRNRGDGSFEDITLRSGLRNTWGYALGVVVGDFNDDGWLDLYVANDSVANQMWINTGEGGFADLAARTGSAVNEAGRAEASMGVELGDVDGDGDEDLFMTHLSQESNTLYTNDGNGYFSDTAVRSQLAAPSWSFTGFGTSLLDFDNDGDLDAVVVNGAVKSIESLVQQGHPYPLGQTNQLFRNLGDGRFDERSSEAGPAFDRVEVSRGLAVGDLDNDGDPDLVLFNSAGPARILLNQVGQSYPWVGIHLSSQLAGGSVIGSLVTLVLGEGSTLRRRAQRAGSYASARDPRLRFGLQDGATVVEVRVRWTSGLQETWPGAEIDRYNTLEEGSGTTVGDPVP